MRGGWRVVKPKNIEFEITTVCNYSCMHCYCNAGSRSKAELKTEEIFNVIDQLIEAEIDVLDIVGGEPLIRDDLIDVLTYGHYNGLNMLINTNASLATKKKVKEIRKVVSKLSIGVSLDGPRAEIHEKIRGIGTFEKTYNGLMNFIDAGFDVTILFAVNKINYYYIDEMIELAQRLGVNLYVDRFIPVGRGMINKELLLPSREMIESVSKSLKNFLSKNTSLKLYIEENIFGEEECTAGKTHASILVDGNVVPCGHFRYRQEFYVGNVKKERFKNIWERMKFFRRKLFPEKCIECSLKKFNQTSDNFCASGCLAAALFDEKYIDTRVCKIY